jgi:hypothetical protein
MIARDAALLVVGLALALAPAWASGGTTAPPRQALGAIVLTHLGAGYTVTAQGPLDAAPSPPGSPDSAVAGALSKAGGTVATYQRSWRDATGVNTTQDLVVRFSTAADARAAVGGVRRTLARREVVGSGAVAGVPGAQRTTYLASTTPAGVGQAITMSAGTSVALLTFFSAAAGNAEPVTPAFAGRVARAQYAAMAAAAGPTRAEPPAGGVSLGDVGWAVLAVVVLAAAVATPLALRRGRPAATSPEADTESG